MRFPALLALLALALLTVPAHAVIMKLTHLGEVLEGEDHIFVATVDKLDPDKPLAVFKIEKQFKGDAKFDRLAVNMTGTDEAKKAGDPKTIFDRLDTTRKVIFFVGKRGKRLNAKAFVEGSWFSVQGVEDEADKVVRWAFQCGEPFLRRTFKGTSAELIKIVEDGLAGKAKPPMANEKEKEGYGPPVEKKDGKKCEESRGGGRATEDLSDESEASPLTRLCLAAFGDLSPRERGEVLGDWRFGEVVGRANRTHLAPLLRGEVAGGAERRSAGEGVNRMDGTPQVPTHSTFHALFGVIPSFVLVGPLAVIAALFPGVFAKMAIGMKRWRAFLVVASVASTAACVYWVLSEFWPSALPGGWIGGPAALTTFLMLGTIVALTWAGRRYRRMAAEDAAITNLPGKSELYALAGMTAAIGVIVSAVGLFGDWQATVVLPMREITFIGIALGVATLYAGYRKLTAKADTTPAGTPASPRMCVSGESVALVALALCWFTTLVGGSTVATVTGGETGDADAIGPRFVGVKTFELKKSSQVMSGITVAGDRLYFGAQFSRGTKEGQLICIDRETGEEKWRFEGDSDLAPVFSTPAVVDGKVYSGEGLHEDKGCRMFCVNAADGKPVWPNPGKTTSHTEGSPAVVGGRAYFTAGDDGLIAVDAKTGAEVWRFQGGKEAGIHIDATPAVSGKRIFVGSGLYSYVAAALDADTGKEIWRTDLKLRSFGAPLASGKYVYYGVGTGNMLLDVHEYTEESGKKEENPAGAVVCLEAETGKEVWRYDLPRSVHTGIVGDAFSVYAACRDGNVYAFDRKTGKLRWSRGAGGPSITAPPAVATSGGAPVAVYAVASNGNVVCLNPHTGAVVWQKPLPGYSYFPLDNEVVSGPTVVTAATPTGSKRTIYVGAMTVDPDNPAKKSCAVFRFEDEIGGE